MVTHRGIATLTRIVILAGLLLLVVGVGLTGMRLYQHVTQIKSRLDRIESIAASGQGALGSDTFSVLRQEISGGRRDFAALKGDVAWFLPIAPRLSHLPVLGPTFEALPHVVAMGENFLAAAGVLLDGLDPLLQIVQGGDKASAGAGITERALPALITAQPRIVAAQDLLEQAAAERAQFASLALPGPLARPLERLDKYIPSLLSLSQAAAVAPVLLGGVRPMTYVILAQNNDELRPTGGFISAVGLLTMDQGKIARLEFKDAYAVDDWAKDHPAAPEPLARYMDAQLWVFRDSNFWPDFPTSAKAAEFFSQIDLGLHPDGVIAVDQLTLQILVDGLGSLVVPEDNNAVLTAANTITKIRAYWKPHSGTSYQIGDLEAWTPERKQYIANVFQAMRAKIETDARSINLARFGKAVLRALDEKHILLYLAPPLGSGLSEGSAWGAAIPDTTSDYLYAVDTNMGFNKVNGIMQKSIDYAVSIDDAGLARAQATITYRNPSTRSIACIQESLYEATYDLMMNRCYWNYLRLYVPEGATLVDDDRTQGVELVTPQEHKQVWASWMVTAPRQTQDAVFSYYLPNPVLERIGDNWKYRLLVQKQPGTDSTPLHVTVTLPAQAQVISASPAAKSIAGNVVTFESPLRTDQEFTILIRK